MIICKTKGEIRAAIKAAKENGATIGAVPTMGALHPGHLSLIETAKKHADQIVATIFVNPLQFGPNEDFESYPRTMDTDLELLKANGTDYVFAPVRSELIADNFSTKISVGGVGEDHCALSRPQFFDGVATIVTKLLMILSPDVAVFGEKDYQQLAVIRRFVRDLDIPTKIVGSPLIREDDGLAMSSRNEYLTPEERALAPKLYATMNEAAEKFIAENGNWPAISEAAMAELLNFGFQKVDYLNMVDAQTLEHIEQPTTPGRLLAAAWMGRTRLIDNIAVNRPANAAS